MIFYKTLRVFMAAAILASISLHAQAVVLTKLEINELSAGRTQLELTFNGTAPEPVGYSVERPARIALDFADTENRLPQKRFAVGSGNLRNAIVVSTADRTRLVLSMATLMPYNVTVSGRRVRVIVGPNVQQSQVTGSTPAFNNTVDQHAAKVSFSNHPQSASNPPMPRLLSAHWQGDHQLQLKLSADRAQARMYQDGSTVRLRLAQYRVPPTLAQPWAESTLPDAVQSMAFFQDGDDALLHLQLSHPLIIEAFQNDGLVTLALQPNAGVAGALEDTADVDNDTRLTMNLQDIEVRYALQQIADYVGLNLVAADSVQGRITLRLQDVSWQEALDLVLRSKNLDKRLNGSVLLVAPAQELAEQEQLALENRQRAEQLAPLEIDFIQVNYAKADDILGILNNQVDEPATPEKTSLGFLSERGAVSIDSRTNTLIVRDTAANLASIRRAVEHFDVPVRQVLIEARIVAARTSVGEQLGVRWGGNINSGGSSPVVVSGSLDSTSSIGSGLNASNGHAYEQVYPDALVVDLPVTNPSASSFAIGVAAFDYALDLELSALETRGSAEVVSQPRVVTSNGQEAFINSGQTIAFDGAEGGTTFVDAGLSLRVTPQITPDDHVVLDLVVTQDSLAAGGGAIDTNSVTTQVLVDDGETLVLGGVYRTETITTIEKTPWLGDLPILGRLFRRTADTEEKTELLVFITPSLVADYLAAN
ncbi:hypothetical protein BGP77_17135 [Saccharospirillum sp. MSK14-1]|uniref:type IV pilus secretin PilQ n=1 Tax=Saccharospirillum sp. MSK14-1 TaxID=1897632 RepID=UPI000D3A88CF|nr:type IV pilus secretin PilQ [Saccharospirillum sp. MSK14-1]PTY38170.1 hypothetical protein BGP77_17135 [Saccharospirillum sp. MSK14-1]